jgi:hypothetical protein
MNKVLKIAEFVKGYKRISKKHKSLADDLEVLGAALQENGRLGVSLGGNCYKVRLKISSNHKGKSGGARVITYFYVHQQTVYLLAIYDKAEMDTIETQALKVLMETVEKLTGK